MTERLRLRPAGRDDLAGLVELEEACFAGDRFSRRSYRHLLVRGHADVLVAEDGQGRLAGSAVLLYRRGSSSARLYSLAVRPDLRGRGLGRAMLAAVERAALFRGATRVVLEVAEGNQAALALYLRAGYETKRRLSDYYESGEDALRMQKSLVSGGHSGFRDENEAGG